MNAIESVTRAAPQNIPPQNNGGENARIYNKRNKNKRINTITNDEIVTTPEEKKHRSLETSAKRRRRSISERERERSLKSARDLDVPI